MSPLVPLPCKLNHSFSQCFLSSTPLYAHRLAPSLVTFPRRFSQDIVRGGRKRAFLSNKRKGDWRMWKASIQAGSQGLGAATSSGGRRGLLLLSRGWARDPGQGPGAMQRLLGWRWSVGASSASASPLLCPLGHRLRTPHIQFTCTNNLSLQSFYSQSQSSQ